MCTIRLIELVWQNSKAVSCKMHALLQNAIGFELLYSGLYEPISKLCIYKNSAVHLSDARVTFFFGKVKVLRNPTIMKKNIETDL